MSTESDLQNVPSGHGSTTRAVDRKVIDALAGHGDPGKFGRMFDDLPELEAEDDALADLAAAMLDRDGANASQDNPNIPAGLTYLGQFVDHDLTLDTTPLGQQDVDPLSIENFRTPALDLDSLYADGPGVRPDLYQRKKQPPYGPTNKFFFYWDDRALGGAKFA